ncbi:hypothetical protein [Devosia sp. DBB001]|nr:hypothetical protein [Devosia sp. DBB001]
MGRRLQGPLPDHAELGSVLNCTGRRGCDGRPTHRTSPDLIRGLLHPSIRVEVSVGPGSAAGEVQ